MSEGEEAGHRDHATRIFASQRARTVADCSTDSGTAHPAAAVLCGKVAEAVDGVEDTVGSEEEGEERADIQEELIHQVGWEAVPEAGILTKLMRARYTNTELPALTAVVVAAVDQRRMYAHLISWDHHQILMHLLQGEAEVAVGRLNQSVDLLHMGCSPCHRGKAVGQTGCLDLAHWDSLDVDAERVGVHDEAAVGVRVAFEEAMADVLHWGAAEIRSHTPHRGVVSALSLVSRREVWPAY